MPSFKPVLGRAKDSEPFSSNGSNYTLTTNVEVMGAKTHRGEKLKSSLWYEARYSLKEESSTKPGKNVGHLYAYLVDKTKQDGDGDLIWIDENLKQRKDRTELQMVMQELYTVSGNVKKQVRDHADELQGDCILFIDSLFLKPEFHGKGLAQLAVSAFHRLLTQVSKGHDYSGTIVLSPAGTEDYLKENGKTEVEIERGLIKSYEKSGYEVWKKGKEDVEDSVTVMGFVMPPVDEDDEDLEHVHGDMNDKED